MFQFPCRFAFLSTIRLSDRTLKITQNLTLYIKQTRQLWCHSVKKAQFCKKIRMNVKVTMLDSL